LFHAEGEVTASVCCAQHHSHLIRSDLGGTADGQVLARGHDAIRVSAGRKIVSVIAFAPSVGKP
jgi:hypothetical protein